MKYICKLASIVMLLTSLPLHAGFQEFTMHSRANCAGFNESVSWHYMNHRYLFTGSEHYNRSGKVCDFGSGWAYTWRAAAFHVTEGYGGWYVKGYHWEYSPRTHETVLLRVTDAIDCNIYNGWWDV